jgi:hypothetical protein
MLRTIINRLAIINRLDCTFYRGSVVLALTTILATGCDTVIHQEANIGGIDTLSIDAKQRLMVVADRVSDDGAAQKRVACTEPSPDALVAKAAAIAASANVLTGTGSAQGGGEVGAGFSENAASIAFRDHTVQMLRDGYYRLCEAYMNGGLSETKYKLIVMNADTFMVVASALQTLGANPVAPAVVISSGDITTSAGAPGAGTANASVTISGGNVAIGSSDGKPLAIKNAGADANYQMTAEKAQMAADIINDYLHYRLALAKDMRRIERAERAKKAAAVARYPGTFTAEK